MDCSNATTNRSPCHLLHLSSVLQRIGAPSPDGSADGMARELQVLKDRMSQQTNRMAVLEQKVC
jgi:hypothetical protein